GRWDSEFKESLSRIWWAVCSIILWQSRNLAVHEGKRQTALQQVDWMWTNCLRQLNAVARKESRRTATRAQGIKLRLSIGCLDSMEGELAQPAEPLPPQAPWPKQMRWC
ncbi:hypothetical protein JG687_00014916, partial [Phytophthora cactorum]